MTRALATIFLVVILVMGLAGCDSGDARLDSGGVTLSITDFDELPVQVSVSAATAVGLVSLGEVVISNVPVNPAAGTSDLMNVEIQSYQITFSRGDGGTRVPNPLTRGIFGVAPVSGSLTINDLPILFLEQLRNPPLIDLVNFGVDQETGSQTILLNFRLIFFGRTLAGDEVQTGPANFTIEFIP